MSIFGTISIVVLTVITLVLLVNNGQFSCALRQR